VSVIEGCQLPLSSITHVRQEAKNAARTAGLDPRFVEVVFQEADEVLGAVPGAVLALRNNVLQANAGVDQSNAGGNEFMIVLPRDPVRTAERIRKEINALTGKKIAIIIADSKTHPLRRGTSGFALAVSGFRPIIDDIGNPDLYGRPMNITSRAIADNIVSAAEILMGETNQRVPVVIARGCKGITFEETREIEKNNSLMKISPHHCIYMGPLWYNRKSKMEK
ncbi:MAG: coenzyme F420-0:L-glutamate ligase, partial [Candidatus Hodarchaeota archaeon]